MESCIPHNPFSINLDSVPLQTQFDLSCRYQNPLLMEFINSAKALVTEGYLLQAEQALDSIPHALYTRTVEWESPEDGCIIQQTFIFSEISCIRGLISFKKLLAK